MSLVLNGTTGIVSANIQDGTITAADLAAGAARANLGPGTVVQVVRTESTANTSGTTPIPCDNTIPQQSEGIEMLTSTITPTSASSKLYVVGVLYVGEVDNISNYFTAAMFRDSGADAILSASFFPVGDERGTVVLSAYENAVSTAATTFKIRVGLTTGSTNTLALNIRMGAGTASFPLYGGTYKSHITIMEISQ